MGGVFYPVQQLKRCPQTGYRCFKFMAGNADKIAFMLLQLLVAINVGIGSKPLLNLAVFLDGNCPG